MRVPFLVLLLLEAVVLSTAANGEVCIEGYVMDLYCINRGTLLDNPSVTTLESPERHSVHCLVDVARCYESGFNVLLPNPSGSPRYARALKLDARGNDLVIKLARATGKPGGCSTCKGMGTLTHGFRATFVGKITGSSDDGPSTLSVTNVTDSPKLFNSSALSDGCPPGMPKPNLTLFSDSGEFKVPSIAHGSLMIFGWGFLLPTGVSAAHFLRHRPNALWFKLHRVIQIIGLLVAISGWSIALANFGVFNGIVDRSFVHGLLGMTTMVLGILQPFNALIRPHPPAQGEARPLKRFIWEIVHKGAGYTAVFLSVVTILFGTFIIFDHNSKFRAAWIVTLVWILVFTLACAWDRRKWRRQQADIHTNDSSAIKSQDAL